MIKKKNKEITNIELLKSINRSFSNIEKKMATKDDLKNLATKIEIEQIRVDLRGFKQETRENFEEVNQKIDDLIETIEDVKSNHESRIEVLEGKTGL